MNLRRKNAFTLVELLVVMGIISVLIGILIPVLGAARTHAKRLTELSAARQLVLAYTAYAGENRGAVIPGHILDSKLSILDDRGKPLTGEPVKRWPWRLAASIKYGIRGSILVNEQDQNLQDRTISLWSYFVSLNPTLGLNQYGLGGEISNVKGVNKVSPDYAVRKASQVSKSSRMIVFCSARGPGQDSTVEGYFKVVPPTTAFEYSATGWNPGKFDPQVEPAAWGYVHPRWKNKAVVACLDGHTELLTLEELRDMTRWVEPAAEAADPNWKP